MVFQHVGRSARVVICRIVGENDHLMLKDLSQKLGLLALTAIERVSEVIAHDLRYRHYSCDGATFHLPELTKKSRVGSTFKSSFHASFPNNPKLCVVECLNEYERQTIGFHPIHLLTANINFYYRI